MEKVVVAMSGGIDSSVSALILKQQGYDVIGITLKLFKDKSIKCCGGDDAIEKFKKICNHIGIKYYIKDAVKIFEEAVVKNFVSGYLNGYTPNPCVECNRVLKFDYLLKLAKLLGADKLSTGHYARIEKKDGEYVLKRGVDLTKDQSYFLYPIKKEYLKDIIFPIGNLTKKEVKEIARKNNIPVDLNKESKDICFIPEGDYYLWLKKNGFVKNQKGYFKDTSGKIIGVHNGYYKFTIGQRKGLGISMGERAYVVGINPDKNEVIVGSLKDAFKRGVVIKNINWIYKIPKDGERLFAQIRYKNKPSSGIINYVDDKIVFYFNETQFAITSGQSIVFYDGDIVVGGGVIKDVFN